MCRPVAAADDEGPATAWSGTSGATASPVSRKASHSQVVRYQRVRAATSGSWRSSQRAAGSGPERPAADAGRRRQLVGLGGGARVEERDRRARRLAAVVDGGERRAVPVDADRDDVDRLGRAQRADGADHRGPPRPRVLLRPARPVPDLEPVARPERSPGAGRRARRGRP